MLYEGLALLAGALIALMVTANGLLAAQTGLWMSTLIIHVCGLVTVSLILLGRRKPVTLRAPGAPWYLYIAGVGGVFTTVLNNLCFDPLGAALMLAMTIVGQLVGSCFIDHFGWFGMKRYPFRAGKLVGFAIMAAGLALMAFWSPASLSPSPLPKLVYILLALVTGINLAFTNTLNAALGARIGIFPGALVNYIAGLSTVAVCVTVLGRWAAPAGSIGPLLLTGGVLGVLIIAMTSLAMPRISVVYATLLLLVGQLVAGMAVDAVGRQTILPLKIAGCVAIVAGLLYNLQLDKGGTDKTAEKENAPG